MKILIKDLIKLPEGKLQFLHKDKIEWSLGWCEGRNKLREKIGNISVCLDVGKIEKILGGDCLVRWKERGYGVVCGHPLPCPKHTDIDIWRKEIAQHLADNIGEIIKETS